MWFEKLEEGESWMGIWKGLFTCPHCHALIKEAICPICGNDHRPKNPYFTKVMHRGIEIEVPMTAMAGAIEWTTHLLLEIMKREYERPKSEKDLKHQIPQNLVIVILFWSFFESLMDKLFGDALKDYPNNIKNDLLKRYSSVGSRMGQLYKIIFSTTFKEDLYCISKGHIYEHIRRVHERRNEFIHGNPEAIDESLVRETIKYLQETQETWITIYNKRCTHIN